MRCAGIDIGTNTILMVIGEQVLAAGWKTIVDVHRIPRLGEGVDASNQITRESLERARHVLREFRSILDEQRVDCVRAVATSAVRDASNRSDVVEALEEILRSPIEIIDGRTEGMLTFKGAVPSDETDTIMIDIGGGSTEIVRGAYGEVSFAESIEIGSVRFSDRYAAEHPISIFNQNALRREIRNVVHNAISNLQGCSLSLIAVAGTPTSLAMLALQTSEFDEKVIDGFTLTPTTIHALSEQLLCSSIDQLYALPGIDRKRADVLPVGAAILDEAMEFINAPSCRVSTKGLRYGAMVTSI